MKWLFVRNIVIFVFSLLLLMVPAVVNAQPEQTKNGPPPIGQQLVREGAFAINLASALAVVTTDEEVEAESQLGGIGITPRNGWIADYPVTPDIISELQGSVLAAAAANKLSMGSDEALKRFEDVKAGFALGIKPYTGDKTPVDRSTGSENYSEPTVINNYYYEQGPPVVTYYTPPPDYYYLYAWVPSPFWWSSFWFPGFFILNDFHRTVYFNDRVVFVSNHFNDIRRHRVFRIDPAARFEGRTYAGIGASRSRGYIATGVPRSERRIFNSPRTRSPIGGKVYTPPASSGRSITAPYRSGGVTTPTERGGRMIETPLRGGGEGAPFRGGGEGSSQRRERR